MGINRNSADDFKPDLRIGKHLHNPGKLVLGVEHSSLKEQVANIFTALIQKFRKGLYHDLICVAVLRPDASPNSASAT